MGRKVLDLKTFLKEECQEIMEHDGFIAIEISPKNYKKIAKKLRELGFARLMTISAIDWLDENLIEVFFIVRDEAGSKIIKVSTKIPRVNPKIQSLKGIFENADIFECEVWELFGVIFEGNNEVKHLFLEDWDGPPPFRRDFNWRAYVKKEYED